MRERSKRLKKSCWSWVALGALQSCLAVAATAAPGHKPLPPCSTKGDAGLASPPNRNPDHAAQELRRTIEEGVLNGLSRSIMEHGERVESGERRARPFVTLTYAQSIDGSISAADKSQVRGSRRATLAERCCFECCGRSKYTELTHRYQVVLVGFLGTKRGSITVMSSTYVPGIFLQVPCTRYLLPVPRN